MSSIPSTAEELQRKTIETITWLVERRNDGFMSGDQMNAAADALWRATSGLFPPGSGMTEIMTELMNLIDQDARSQRRSLVNQEEVITFDWKIGYSSFRVIKRTFGTVVGASERPFSSAKEAKDKMDAMIAELIKRGWELL